MTIKKNKNDYTIKLGEKQLAALLTIMELYKFEKNEYFNVIQKSETYSKFLKVLKEWEC